MEKLLGTKAVPPGFRFHPTDEELFIYYLKRKVMGKSLNPKMMSDVDVYRFAPWDLPPMSCLKTRDMNWFFFCPRFKKYPNGGRANRATECGYWKSTGNDRVVNYNSRPVGKIKTLVFHLGKAPKGERTDWVMHEYRLEDRVLEEKGVPQDSYVICKIYKKSGLGPKNGENYGAHFVEEEWESDDENAHGSGSVVDALNGASHGVHTPIDAAISVPAALAGTSAAAVADVDTPCFTAAFSLGTPNSVAVAEPVGAPSNAADVGASVDGDEEVERLLSYFTENYVERTDDIFSGLGDLGNLAGTSTHSDIDWKDLYIELADLDS